jgi:hypothetical protein
MIMHDDEIDIEVNMIELGTMKENSNQGEKNKVKEDYGPSYQVKYSHKTCMDDISRVIRNLTNKMSIFEM